MANQADNPHALPAEFFAPLPTSVSTRIDRELRLTAGALIEVYARIQPGGESMRYTIDKTGERVVLAKSGSAADPQYWLKAFRIAVEPPIPAVWADSLLERLNALGPPWSAKGRSLDVIVAEKGRGFNQDVATFRLFLATPPAPMREPGED